jgi:hypothetical protein
MHMVSEHAMRWRSSVVVESTTYESKSDSYTFKSEYESKSLAKFQVRVLNISSPSPSPKW